MNIIYLISEDQRKLSLEISSDKRLYLRFSDDSINAVSEVEYTANDIDIVIEKLMNDLIELYDGKTKKVSFFGYENNGFEFLIDSTGHIDVTGQLSTFAQTFLN